MIRKMVLGCLSLLFCFSDKSFAEVPIVEWTANDYYSYYGGKVAIDNNGNVYKAIISANAWSSSKAITIKYENGNTAWVREYPIPIYSGWYNSSVNIAFDSSNNVYVSAGSYGVIKYDQNGNEQWFRKYGYYGSFYSLAMTADNDGNVYVSGGKYYNYDMTIKYDSYGNILWTASNDGLEYNKLIAVDGSKNVYVASGGYYGASIVKLDANGNRQWIKTYPSTNNSALSMPRQMVVDSLGNIFLVGNSGDFSIVTIKIDTDGREVWKKSYGSGGSSYWGNDIAIDRNGNVYITGQASPNIVTMMYNSKGMEVWAKTVIANGGGGNTIALDSFGNVYTSGYSSDPDHPNYGYVSTTIKYDNCGNEKWIDRRLGIYSAIDSVVDENNKLFVLNSGSFMIKYGYSSDLGDTQTLCGTKPTSSENADATPSDPSDDTDTTTTESFFTLVNEMVTNKCISNSGIANEIASLLSNAMENNNENASIAMLEALKKKISAQNGKNICTDGADKLMTEINKYL